MIIEEMTTEDILDHLLQRFPAVLIGVLSVKMDDKSTGDFHIGFGGSEEDLLDLNEEISNYIKSEFGGQFT